MDINLVVFIGGIVVNLLIFAFGYGRMSIKVERNKQDIEGLAEINRGHKIEISERDSKIFEKIDGLKDFMNKKFLDLSVKLAEISK